MARGAEKVRKADQGTAQGQAGATTSSSSSGVQLRERLRGQSYEEQLATLAPEAPVQLDGGARDSGAVHQAAAVGIQGGGGAMPYGAQIQRAFGHHDIGGVQAHTGANATRATHAMGAEAYATGNHVVFGGSPDLHTAAHEAAHVVQQRAGVSLSGGVGQAGDSYEQHADAVADKVVKGESATGLLDQMAGGSGGGEPVQRRAVQMEGDKDKKPMPNSVAEANELKDIGIEWANTEIRAHYNAMIANIPQLDQQWIEAGLSAEQRAQKAHHIRHNARITCRAMMGNADEIKDLQERDTKKYGNPDGPTFEYLVAKAKKDGLTGDAVYEAIIGSANRSNAEVNKKFGVEQPKSKL